MAHIKKKKLSNGTISYTIQSKARDPLTGKYKYATKTWRKPIEMTEHEAKRRNDKYMFELDEEIHNKVNGLISQNSSIKFCDFVDKWLETQKHIHDELYYIRQKPYCKIIKEFFQQIELNKITPTLTSEFRNSLLNHEIVRESAILKKDTDIKKVVKEKKIRKKGFKNAIGVSHGTYEAANRGNTIAYSSAIKICNGLGIKFNDYFESVSYSKVYEKVTVSHIMGTLNLILNDAKRQRLIEHNFASTEYLPQLKKKRKEIVVLDYEEARKLKEALDTETNMRMKVAIYIVLMTGIRRGELCGLEWKDIDFNNNTMSISRSVQEVSHKGLITKDTKTISSSRIITMPETLVKVLKEYKEWYDKRKKYFKDDWEKTDRLIISDEGDLLRPSNYKKWLQKILERANLKKVTLHSLRHTNITMQLTSGVDLRTVAARAGHSRTSTTTDVYSHFLKSRDEYASQVIDSIFN